MANKLILCDCSGTQTIDPEALSKASGHPCSKLHSELCGQEIEQLTTALSDVGAVICCTQEKNLFEALAAEMEVPPVPLLDLRDRAGWTRDTGNSLPKMSALTAEAMLEVPAAKTLDVISEGTCLIFGPHEVALSAAERLKDILAVTVLLDPGCEPPMSRDYDAVRGNLLRAKGAIGGFTLSFGSLETLVTSGREWRWSSPQQGGASECDIILDLSGGNSLFPAPEKRDGYFRADPRHQASVEEAVFEAAQLVGVFEKTLYLKNDPVLCAHSRASQAGCSKCLDHCPTSAISPKGDHVTIDPMICAGCGACASLCPSGAITYDAPPASALFLRVQTLAQAYLSAGGVNPRLLVTTARGSEMVQFAARYDRGLPVDVVPLEVEALGTFGHAEMLTALAAGFSHVSLLLDPKADRHVLEGELALAEAIAGDGKAVILDLEDPAALCEALYNEAARNAADAAITSPVRPRGSRRQVTRQAALALQGADQQLPLPQGAPYGAVLIDTESCTLCLSCASLCPSGALGDNPDLPQLRFQEDACLQCGICANLCPEQAIKLEPRLNLGSDALSQKVLHEEEPFACIECGALFGVKSAIEKISEKLAGKHAMFADGPAARMIKMCDDCRVQAQFHQENSPLAGAPRPAVRTTEDYLKPQRKQ
ncbi:iron-sulfur cluster-binding protein [Roseobacter sp. SK209-2-6]|uniref:4Fe-4S binding protein n=1 Tax=Roseobacter sp. SK209-2-6 TaxID=388739 RepID=UPI0000F3D64E|nr:4Fe-4S binding protein [Roseobacter sp. SK209-2-6]EBA15723.1 iron-sulfur cluster-binding protein [Roseobacter sp. SK209-2-6]